MRKPALVLVLSLLCVRLASAQDRPATMEARLAELAQRVDEAMRAAADSAAALAALQEVQRQLTELQKEADRQKDLIRGYQETRRALEQLEARLGNAELQIAARKLESGQGEGALYQDGFLLRTPDRRFQLKVNGLLQAGYQGLIFAAGAYPADGVLGKNRSSFLLRRAAVALSGHLYLQQLAYRIELDFGSQDPGPLLEGWAEVRLHRAVNLRAGQQKIPLGRQLLAHSSRLVFAERSGPVQAFAPGWDLGAVLQGEIPIRGGLSYQVGIFNGAGAAETNDNVDLLYVVRLAAEPLGRLAEGEGDPELSPFRFSIGGAFAYNLAPTDLALRKGISDPGATSALSDKDGDGNVDNVAVYTAAAELGARYAGLSLEGELFYRREDPGRLGGDETLFGSGFGIYGQLGYLLPFMRDLQVAARYSYWEPTHFGANRSVYLAERIHEVGAVVNLLTWRRLIKWQLEYDHQWQRGLRTATQVADQGANLHLVRLQVQAAF